MGSEGGNRDRNAPVVPGPQAVPGGADAFSIARHEIRTPLGAILTTSEVLLKSGLTDQQRKYATILHDAAEALVALSDRLFAPEGQQSLGTRRAFVPAVLARSVVGLYESTARGRGLTLAVSADTASEDEVGGYPAAVRQILTNLVDNALKYSERGTITVSAVRNASNTADLVVCDNGPGISDADGSRLFEPGFRGQAENGDQPGEGLGLFTAHALANRLGGTLVLEESGPQGSCFRLRLPVQGIDSDPTGSPGTDPTVERAGPYAVLVVDDSPTARTLAETILSAFGWSVTATASAMGALDLLKKAPDAFDCVLTDLSMPEMGGLELARAIRAEDVAPTCPVLAVSARHPSRFGDADRQEVLAGYVPKPYSADLLYRTIVEAIEQSADRR
ncbi:MAG: ATP-binding protein [Pseudomonadota bacterium]